MNNIVICPDGFIWFIIGKDLAKAVYDVSDIILFKIYPDGSDAMVENYEDFIKHDGDFGIEIGYIQDLQNKLQNILSK